MVAIGGESETESAVAVLQIYRLSSLCKTKNSCLFNFGSRDCLHQTDPGHPLPSITTRQVPGAHPLWMVSTLQHWIYMARPTHLGTSNYFLLQYPTSIQALILSPYQISSYKWKLMLKYTWAHGSIDRNADGEHTTTHKRRTHPIPAHANTATAFVHTDTINQG
jgi:hypothetical protein